MIHTSHTAAAATLSLAFQERALAAANTSCLLTAPPQSPTDKDDCTKRSKPSWPPLSSAGCQSKAADSANPSQPHFPPDCPSSLVAPPKNPARPRSCDRLLHQSSSTTCRPSRQVVIVCSASYCTVPDTRPCGPKAPEYSLSFTRRWRLLPRGPSLSDIEPPNLSAGWNLQGGSLPSGNASKANSVWAVTTDWASDRFLLFWIPWLDLWKPQRVAPLPASLSRISLFFFFFFWPPPPPPQADRKSVVWERASG